mgnify:CR=1 FL=1
MPEVPRQNEPPIMSHLPPPTSAGRPPAPPAPRLGGMLMVIFWCACGITAVPLAVIFSVVANLGVAGAQATLADGLSGQTISAQLLRLGLVPQAALFVWGAATVILTVTKSRHGLVAVPWLLVVWLVVSIYSQFAIRSALSPNGTDTMDFAALMPSILLQVTAVAALFGYFSEGTRPKAYYRR